MHARDGAAPTIVSDSRWPNCPRESTVFGRCEMLRDGHAHRDARPPDLASLPSGAALPAPRQVLAQVQAALGLRVDPLVEALVADPHHGVAGVLQLQPALDQPGAPSTAQRVHHPRAQPVRVHAPRFAGPVAPQVGPPLRREGGVERHGRPRTGLQPPRPVRAVRPVLVGREPQSPFQLAADAASRS